MTWSILQKILICFLLLILLYICYFTYSNYIMQWSKLRFTLIYGNFHLNYRKLRAICKLQIFGMENLLASKINCGNLHVRYMTWIHGIIYNKQHNLVTLVGLNVAFNAVIVTGRIFKRLTKSARKIIFAFKRI